MTFVKLREGEGIEEALRRFKRECERNGVLKEIKRRRALRVSGHQAQAQSGESAAQEEPGQSAAGSRQTLAIMMIPAESFGGDLSSKLDIVELVGEYVPRL